MPPGGPVAVRATLVRTALVSRVTRGLVSAAAVFPALVVGALLVGTRAAAALPPEQVLLDRATDPRAGIVERTRAFADLQAVAGEASIARLAPLLIDPEWSFAARLALETLPGAAADRALLDALDSAPSDALRAGMVNSLGNRRCAAAVPALARLAAAPDPALASAALNALGSIATPAAGEALAQHRPPAALRSIRADALVRVAAALAPTDPSRAIGLYRLASTEPSAPQASAATIALARLAGSPVEVILGALTSPDRARRTAALALVRAGEFGPELIAALGREISALPPDVQIQVLSVLYDRGDRTAAELARRALAVGHPGVRAAAAKLLSAVGEPRDAPALIRLMAGEGEVAAAARQALSRIPGDDTTARLVEVFRRGGDDRPAALEVLVERGHRALLPELLQPALHADAAFRPAAAKGILALATGPDLGPVLALHAALPPDQRTALGGVLRGVAAKHPAPDVAAATVLEAAENLPAERARLYGLLASLGGETTLRALTDALGSATAEFRRAAVQALGSWGDARPAGALLALARTDPDTDIRDMAIRSATAVLTRSALEAEGAAHPDLVPSAVARLRSAWELADRPETKATVLGSLRRLKDPRATAAAAELESSAGRPAPAPGAAPP